MTHPSLLHLGAMGRADPAAAVRRHVAGGRRDAAGSVTEVRPGVFGALGTSRASKALSQLRLDRAREAERQPQKIFRGASKVRARSRADPN